MFLFFNFHNNCKLVRIKIPEIIPFLGFLSKTLLLSNLMLFHFVLRRIIPIAGDILMGLRGRAGLIAVRSSFPAVHFWVPTFFITPTKNKTTFGYKYAIASPISCVL